MSNAFEVSHETGCLSTRVLKSGGPSCDRLLSDSTRSLVPETEFKNGGGGYNGLLSQTPLVITPDTANQN